MTIHYRGCLKNLDRVEDFEDRLLDLALELGGQAQIWRSRCEDDPRREVRGIILSLTPGQEPTSFLLSPEGWLIGLVDIEDAEYGRLSEPPWCFVKTQFGSIEGHVALVELLHSLQTEFLSQLEVGDEGGYWETRNLTALTRKHAEVQSAIDGLSEGLGRYGLSTEAAEDPEILMRRIERVARLVQRTLHRPAEHPQPDFGDTPAANVNREEAAWDDWNKHERRQQEWLHRAVEQRLANGEDHRRALANAIRDLGLTMPGDENEFSFSPVQTFAEEDDTDGWKGGEGNQFVTAVGNHSCGGHPLLRRATELYCRVHLEFRDASQQHDRSLQTLLSGLGDLTGGLAQAVGDCGDQADAVDAHGLRAVQLKRALRGAAFAFGAVFGLQAGGNAEFSSRLQKALRQLEDDIFQELARLRAAHVGQGGDDE